MAKKFITLVPTVSVVVVRDGKRVPVEPQKPFKFTPEEIENIKAVQPNALRSPINESAKPADDEDEGEDLNPEADDEAETEAKGKAKGKKGSKPSKDDDDDL